LDFGFHRVDSRAAQESFKWKVTLHVVTGKDRRHKGQCVAEPSDGLKLNGQLMHAG